MPDQIRTLEYWAKAKPTEIAVVEGGVSMDWATLNNKANSVAEGLAKAGLSAGEVVCVRLQIRIEWLVINAALSKLGCSLLGLNWRLTPDETRYVLNNSGAKAIILDDANPVPLIEALQDMSLQACVLLEGEYPGAITYRTLEELEDPAERVMERDAPLIIYTSGTTGLPKGVVIQPHNATPQQVEEYVADVQEKIPYSDQEVVLVTMPFSHGSGPAQVRSAMERGSPVILLRRYDAETTLSLIEKHRVTAWVCVPTMLKRMAALESDVLAKYDVSSLCSIQVGAAPVPSVIKEWASSYFGDDILHEGYGSTETGMITHMSPQMLREREGSSGLPYRHVSISIRDDQGNSLPVGERGEIWVRTPFVIRQYLGAGELGPEVLDEDGYFRTGDVGSLDADGYLYLSDRAKDMIVSGGVNIYPAEIEKAMQAHPDIQDVAVIGVPDEEFGEQVKAFVELRPGRTVSATEIMDFSARTLASYKRPKSIEIVAELPRNTTGKVMKRDLRAVYWKDRERAI